MDKIKYSDWKKVEMKVGLILAVERVANTDKLYKLQVDVGESEPRQIVSGLVPFYTVEDLMNKKIIVLTNLEPAKFKGEESNGMLLCAENTDENTCVFLTVEKDAKVGAIVT